MNLCCLMKQSWKSEQENLDELFHKDQETAQKALAKISQSNQNRIVEVIRALEIEPRPPGCKKLSGREAWRIRIGNY